MTQGNIQPTDEMLDVGTQLLSKDISNAYGFLGIQLELLETNQSRLERGRAIPEWSDTDAYTKVLGTERASLDDLKKYAVKGKTFVKHNLKKIEPNLRVLLCKDFKVRPEIENLESDTKELLKYISSGMVGLIAANLPAGVVGSAASIATVLAAIVIKNKIEKFCQSGVNAIELQE